jgi:hypothetical protein
MTCRTTVAGPIGIMRTIACNGAESIPAIAYLSIWLGGGGGGELVRAVQWESGENPAMSIPHRTLEIGQPMPLSHR